MSNPRAESDNYDPHIIPAETAARKEREGGNFKQTRDETHSSIDPSGGQTVDKEGLANNYPIEPEMYINEPGDLREEAEAETARRKAELREINQNEEKGKVTTESDERGKGVGAV